MSMFFSLHPRFLLSIYAFCSLKGVQTMIVRYMANSHVVLGGMDIVKFLRFSIRVHSLPVTCFWVKI
jgi:hypothetical protein